MSLLSLIGNFPIHKISLRNLANIYTNTEIPEEIFEQLCTVCTETKSIKHFETQYNSDCTHKSRKVCDSCMYEYVRHAWNVGHNITCPECSARLTHDAIELILLKNDDTTLYERYDELDLSRILEMNPEFIWCAHGCGSGQLHEGGSMNKIVKCINCNKLTCFTHKCPWHEEMTCEEYDMPRNEREMHASECWIGTNTKDCPQCYAHIEKNEGCDHMTCWKCKHEFCWECMARYANIKRHGAYLHKRTCKHFPKTDSRSIFVRLWHLV